MADKKDKSVGEAVKRAKASISQEVEQHKDEDIDLDDLEDVSGGWAIYFTDSDPH